MSVWCSQQKSNFRPLLLTDHRAKLSTFEYKKDRHRNGHCNLIARPKLRQAKAHLPFLHIQGHAAKRSYGRWQVVIQETKAIGYAKCYRKSLSSALTVKTSPDGNQPTFSVSIRWGALVIVKATVGEWAFENQSDRPGRRTWNNRRFHFQDRASKISKNDE